MNSEFFEAVKMIEAEKGIPAQALYEKIQTAVVTALRREYNGKDVVFCDIDPEKQNIKIYLKKLVVEEVQCEDSEISLEKAKEYKKRAKVGDYIEIKLEPKKFGRIAAQTAKNVIRQGIKDSERDQTMQEFQSKIQDLVTAKVLSVDPKTGNVVVQIGRAESILPKNEQIPGETFTEGQLIKIYIFAVKGNDKEPRAMISRAHPGLVKRLFETEVPEIYDGTVEIKSVSREAGSRTKIAVCSKDENVDAVGSCIGPRGARVGKVVETLGGEKIDIVQYSDDPKQFISAALAPADVLSVEIDENNQKTCQVTVPDTQLSLAIGNKGQNVRLAAKLTGWKIDIRPESGFYEG